MQPANSAPKTKSNAVLINWNKNQVIKFVSGRTKASAKLITNTVSNINKNSKNIFQKFPLERLNILFNEISFSAAAAGKIKINLKYTNINPA